MKFILFFTTFLSASLLACDSGNIIIGRSSGFGFSSMGGFRSGVSQTVNVPVFMDGKRGCWKQKGGLSFEVKEDSRRMNVILPKAQFKNIPGRIMSYALLEKDLQSLRMDIATFACVGNTVISAETFSGYAEEARAIQEMDFRSSSVFATGAAAEVLSTRKTEAYRSLGKSSELPGKLEEYFQAHFKGSFSSLEIYDVKVPSVLLGASMRTPLSQLNSSYSTRVLTKSACSPEFEAVMGPLRLNRMPLPQGVKAKLSKEKLELSW